MRRVLESVIVICISYFICSCSSDNESKFEIVGDELWVMVKMDSEFREEIYLQLVDDITKKIEEQGVGYLDGHSSGAYQFDFNFVDVTNFKQAKNQVELIFKNQYPQLMFMVSHTYEMKYEKAGE